MSPARSAISRNMLIFVNTDVICSIDISPIPIFRKFGFRFNKRFSVDNSFSRRKFRGCKSTSGEFIFV